MDYLSQDFSSESVAALTIMEKFILIQKVKLSFTLDSLHMNPVSQNIRIIHDANKKKKDL